MIVARPKKKKKDKDGRYRWFKIIMYSIFAAMIIKLLYIQVYKHNDYVDKANATSTKFVAEKAPRGIIYDQDGKVLATNEQKFTITYTSTEESNKVIYSTIDKVLNILGQNGEKFQDDFILKVDNDIYLGYESKTSSGQKDEDLRFKKDRGFDEDVKKKLFGNDYGDLSNEQEEEVDEELLKISPREVFYELVKDYNLINLIDPEPSDEKKEQYKKMTGEELTNLLLEKYDYTKLRNYMLVKDAIKIQGFKGSKSVTLAKNISKDTAVIIMQMLNDIPGIDVPTEPTRIYPYGTLASSVIGYLSSIDSGSADKYKLRGYDVSTDLIGVSGIEAAVEDQLKGVKGGATVKVNSKGRTTEELFKLQSYPGNNVHLTIDADIQYAAEEALKDTMTSLQKMYADGRVYSTANRGAAVAVEVNTGRILASVSYPNYDPNEFTSGLSMELNNKYFNPDYEAYAKYLINSKNINKTVDQLFPMNSDGVRTDPYDLYPRNFYNYATQGLIPPGSTFKPLTAVAGLEEGVITPSETIRDDGTFDEHKDVFGGAFAPKCWNAGGHGSINLSTALEVSCNYYFYEVGYRLYKAGGSNIQALDKLSSYAYKFGLGVDPKGEQRASTGIEIEENFGQVYNFKSFKDVNINSSKYYLRDFLEAGNYNGIYAFIPFDYSDNETDNQDVQKAKKSLKGKITTRLQQVGTDESALGNTEFAKSIISDIKTIMEKSDKYKSNVEAYEKDRSVKVDIDNQAKTIANAISRFVITDTASAITTPAEEVFASIGQSINSFTPMQLAQYISTLANGGTRYKLHYVDKITDSNGKVIQESKPEVLDSIDMKESTRLAIVEGMKRVNNDEDGTATNTWDGFPIKTAGKTGTADFREDQDELGRAPFATYVSFAPAENPQIAVVTVVYDGGHGGYVAGVTRAIYEAYFKEDLLKLDPSYPSKSASYQKYVMNSPKAVK